MNKRMETEKQSENSSIEEIIEQQECEEANELLSNSIVTDHWSRIDKRLSKLILADNELRTEMNPIEKEIIDSIREIN